MEEKEMSTMELLEKREHEAYEELGKLNYGDENRGKVLNELKTLASIRNDYDQTELSRLNNIAKNDIEDRKLDVESEKIKNDKRRMWSEVGKAVLYFVGGFGSMFSSYMMSEWFQRDTQLHRFGEKLHDQITKR